MTRKYRSESFGFIRADDLIKQEEEKSKGRKQLSEEDLSCDCVRCECRRKQKKEEDSKVNKILNHDRSSNAYRED